VAAAHHTSAEGICQQNDVIYRKAENAEEMQQGISWLVQTESARPLLLEVFTDATEDERVLKAYYNSLNT
jgi:2-succinyl-5-enolpyruvyl-6-hydroxy-3-cyclohexene-1-carboxylate synthase